MQIRTEEKTNLLDQNGSLTAPSYGTQDVFVYNKDKIAAPKISLKEWEFYQISNREFCLQLTYGHTSYAGNVNISLIEFNGGKRHDVSVMKFFPGKGAFQLDFSPNSPHELAYNDKSLDFSIQTAEKWRHLKATSVGKVSCDVDLTMSNLGDSMCIATPFDDKRFYYNLKKNFLDLSGKIIVDGKEFAITDDTFALVDSGRGCWPYRHEWYWGSMSCHLDMHTLGFNIGWGFGDTSKATENMLFYDGIAHKLDKVSAILDKSDYMKPWKFTSNDGRFELDFVPTYDNFTETNFLVMHNRCHQVFGNYSGLVTLDNGETIKLEKVHGFCENAKNRW